jgi:hypothetical protein
VETGIKDDFIFFAENSNSTINEESKQENCEEDWSQYGLIEWSRFWKDFFLFQLFCSHGP